MRLVNLSAQQREHAQWLKKRVELKRKNWEMQLKLAKRAERVFSKANERYIEFLGDIAGLEKEEVYGVRTPKYVQLSADGSNIEVREAEL